MSSRDLKNKARARLHAILAIPAVYYSKDRATEVSCTVRVHDRTQRFGDMTGFDYQPAERITTVPEIVALAAEVSPHRGAVFSLAADEVYTVEAVMPRDGLTVTAQVTRMSATEIAAQNPPLSYPGCL